MNGLIYLMGATYPVRTQFSEFSKFFPILREEFSQLPYDHNIVVGKLSELIYQFENKSLQTNEDILYKLLAQDMKRIKSSAETNRQSLENETDFVDSLNACRDKCVELLAGLGLEIDPPTIYLVETLPPPFERATFSAMAPDKYDEEHYGIPRGVYFLKSHLRPIYSRFLLAHELIHTILGEKNPERMGRGLEEGLAEIIGATYLAGNVLGYEVAKNTFYHNRLGYGLNQFWQMYLDYTRMGVYVYNRFGMDGLVEMMRLGRPTIKTIERQCLSEQYDEIQLPSGGWIPEVTNSLDFLTMTFSRDLVVSPLAYYVAQYIEENCRIDDIVVKTGLADDTIRQALLELQDRLFLLLTTNDKVDISDVSIILGSNSLRYELQ